MLTSKDKIFCAIMGLMSAAALYLTWSNNLLFFAQPDNGGVAGFIRDAFANPAAASLGWDLTILAVVVCTLMVQEARRWGVRWVWAYVFFSMTVAISVVFPLFLIARQRRIANARKK